MNASPSLEINQLAIILGASEFPEDNKYNQGGHLNKSVLARSKDRLERYFFDSIGFGFQKDNLLNFFNSDESASSILQQIKDAIGTKARIITDILVYYIGHGGSHGDQNRYVLYLKNMDLASPDTSGLELYSLVEAIRKTNTQAKIHFLIDACFSGLSAKVAYCNDNTREIWEKRIEFLCSSEETDTSIGSDNEDYTVFTGALLDVLLKGVEEEPNEKLSLELLGRKTAELIESRFMGRYPKPIYFPEQRDGQDNPAIIGMPLFPNLAYAMQCCAVFSQSAKKEEFKNHLMFPICEGIRNRRHLIKKKSGSKKALQEHIHVLNPSTLLNSVEEFCEAVRKICRCEIAIFDLTNFEPTIMLMLGIRSVILRGLTICVNFKSTIETTTHNPKQALGENAPFYFKDIKLVNISIEDLIDPKIGNNNETIVNPVDDIFNLIVEGLNQLRENPLQFVDMPSFEAIRQLWSKDEDKKTLPYYDNCLVLCSFSRESQKLWLKTKKDLSDAIIEKGEGDDIPLITRSLDINSPRLVSLVLFDAIRRYQLCIVDLTEWRPNVLFELGVRLAVTDYEPICILRNSGNDTMQDSKLEAQRESLKKILTVINYDFLNSENVNDLQESHTFPPEDFLENQRSRFEQCKKMVQIHLNNIKYRRNDYSELPWNNNGKLKPGSIYKIVWNFANENHEPVTSSVNKYLQEISKLYQVDGTKGLSPFIYPKDHPLSQAANRFGLETSIASLLYLHHRRREEVIQDNKLREEYYELANIVESKLTEKDKFKDEINKFRDKITKGAEMKELITKLNSILVEVKILRKAGEKEPEKYVEALDRLLPFLPELSKVLAEFDAQIDELDRDERKEMFTIAEKLADCYGICGGLAYRRGKEYFKDSLEYYQKGREIELNKRYRISNSYNLVNVIVLKILIQSGLSPEIKSELEQARSFVGRQIDGERQDQWWAWADLGLLNLLLQNTEQAEQAYQQFWKKGANQDDFNSSRLTLQNCADALSGYDKSLAESITIMMDRIIEIKPIGQK